MMERGMLVMVAALAACGGVGGAPPGDGALPGDGAPPPSDAGIDPRDGAPGVDAPTIPTDAATISAVTGRRHQTCHQPTSDVDEPIDLTMSQVEVLLLDPATGGYRVLPGSGDATGAFSVPGVPDGASFLLRINNSYYATALHVIDVWSERTSRCAPAPEIVTDGVPITYALTGMTPVAHRANIGNELDDRLDFASIALGYHASGFDQRLTTGATSATGSLSWQENHEAPLVVAAAGDDLHVFHVRTENAIGALGRYQYATWILDGLDASGATLQVGVPTAVTGVFQHAPEHLLSLTGDLASYQVGARSGWAGGLDIELDAHPRSLAAAGGRLLSISLGDSARSTSTGYAVTDFAYGDPFPATWTRTLALHHVSGRNFHDLYGNSYTLLAHTLQIGPYHEPIDTEPLPAPSHVTVDGVDFDGGGLIPSNGQSAVTVRWDPVPGATLYRVVVLYNDNLRFIGAYWTADTEVKIPAYQFAPGVFYDLVSPDDGQAIHPLVIEAIRSPVDLRTGHAIAELEPFSIYDHYRLPAPIAIAGRVSGRLRFLPHCGDGEIQDGERCDTRGESATCNVDCSLPTCGDGLRNAAAGEECDTAGDSLACDVDCTLPRCGDGHINYALEDCDDGNALDDGNGCSADCKLNNHCGDGIVEDAAEFCDPGPGGDTASCDDDCTPVICGDGHVNLAAGEECDDGFVSEICVNCRFP